MSWLITIFLLGFNARAVALSGAAFPEGIDALKQNPAGLAFYDGTFSMRFPSFLTPIGTYPTYNSAFSISEIDKYFYSGKYLDDNDKNWILSKIESGLKLDAELRTQLEMRLRNFGLGVYVYTGERTDLPISLFELALYGNEIGKSYSIDGLESRSQVLASSVISFGKSLDFLERQAAVGIGFHFYFAPFTSELLDADGYLYTDTTDMGFGASADLLVAKFGKGIGFDVGFIMKDIYEGLDVALSLMDLSPGIKWTNEVKVFNLRLDADSIKLVKLLEEPDSIFDMDTVWEETRESHTTYPPSRINIMISRTFFGNTNVTLLFEKGLKETIWSTQKPYFAVGIEYRPVKNVPLRWGIGFGGREKLVISTGYGLRFKAFSLNFAYQAYRGLFKSSKGGKFAFELGANLP